MDEIAIRVTHSPTQDQRASVLSVLRQFTSETVPVVDNQDFAAIVFQCGAQMVGALIASSRWGGFHIEMLALPSSLRRQGLGSQPIAVAEAEARRRECHHMRLDTHAFQAKPFFERHGFEVFGQIDGPAPYYPRYFMQKILS